MTTGPWGFATLDIVVLGLGIYQSDWRLVSLMQAVGHVCITRVLPSCFGKGFFFLKSTLSSYCLCW